MRKTFAAAVAALVAFPVVTASAASINPADFDIIITEGKRTATVDGADVSGNAWNSRNSDVKTMDIGPIGFGDDILLVGGVGAGGADVFFASDVTGQVDVNVINLAEASRSIGEDIQFGARFDLFLNGALVETMDLFGNGAEIVDNNAFASVFTAGDEVRLRILGLAEVIDFDIGLSVANPFLSQRQALQQVNAVPTPAALPLMFGALAFMGMAGLRRSAKRR